MRLPGCLSTVGNITLGVPHNDRVAIAFWITAARAGTLARSKPNVA